MAGRRSAWSKDPIGEITMPSTRTETLDTRGERWLLKITVPFPGMLDFLALVDRHRVSLPATARANEMQASGLS